MSVSAEVIEQAIRAELRRQHEQNRHPDDLWIGDELDPHLLLVDGYVKLDEMAAGIAQALGGG